MNGAAAGLPRATDGASPYVAARMAVVTLMTLMTLTLTAMAINQPAIAAAADDSAAAHGMTHMPETIAEWAHGARLFAGLGDFHRAITTDVPTAQQYFDQGMRLLWAFNHDESTRSFAKAAELDPTCAACYWGVALTVGPNYNVPAMAAPRARVAFEALHEAQRNATHATPVEKALIGALAARYPSAEPLDPSNLGPVAAAYADEMRKVAARFPDDLDVQTLCAEAEMNVHAWKLWADGKPVEGTLAIEGRLESVLRRDPRHPGANHYYVHVMEASPDPGKALASAGRLSGMMPAAGHLEHMPAHIMQRVGRYEDAAEANRRGIAADESYFAGTAAPDYYAMYLGHNYSFLAYSAGMEGRKAETLAAVQNVLRSVPIEMLLAMGDSGWGLTQQYAALLRFGLWDEMVALSPPQGGAPGLTAGYLYGRGVALASRGRSDEAQRALLDLQQLAAAAPPDAAAGYNTLAAVVAVAQPVVAARIAATARRDTEAVALLEQAVRAEDRLAYNEPSDWFFPVRHLLGAQLLIVGRPREAEQVYRDDLVRNPANGWSLYGLATALSAEGRVREASRVRGQFEIAWQHGDVRLPASAFWIAGPDTRSCECQRLTVAAYRQRLTVSRAADAW
jgi:tetratricopeptide (TPR) repeat protein